MEMLLEVSGLSLDQHRDNEIDKLSLHGVGMGRFLWSRLRGLKYNG